MSEKKAKKHKKSTRQEFMDACLERIERFRNGNEFAHKDLEEIANIIMSIMIADFRQIVLQNLKGESLTELRRKIVGDFICSNIFGIELIMKKLTGFKHWRIDRTAVAKDCEIISDDESVHCKIDYDEKTIDVYVSKKVPKDFIPKDEIDEMMLQMKSLPKIKA